MIKILLSAITLVAFSFSASAETIGTTKGGANYQTGIMVNKVMRQAGIQIIPVPHRSNDVYIQRANKGEIDYGIANPASLLYAYQGIKTAKKPNPNVRFVANLQLFLVAVTVGNESGIDNICGLKGKRAPFATPDNTFHYYYNNVLAVCDLTYKNVKAVPITSTGQMIKKFTQKQTDWSLGVIGAGFMKKWQMSWSGGIKTISIPESAWDKTFGNMPGYFPVVVEPNPKFPYVRKPTTTIGFNMLLFAGKHVPDSHVYEAVKALYKYASDFRKSGLTRSFDESKMVFNAKDLGVPVYSGALKAYEELRLN